MSTIVIIEDNAELREMAAGYLRTQGFVVHTATDGHHGLVEISRVVPDLIVSDISMPGMDGFELRRKLNTLPGLASIPFLFMSAHHEQERIREGMRLGADDFLTKPFKINDLLSAVQSRLQRHRLATEHEREQMDRMSESLQLIFPHEITTPVSQILVAAQLIGEMQPDEQAEYLDMIAQAARRLDRLTKAFRDVTSLTMHGHGEQYGLPVYTQSPQDLAARIREWVNEVVSDLDAAERVQAAVPVCVSQLQPAFVQRLIVELLRNAIMYSSDDVVLNVASTPEGLSITVEDQGHGFDPAAAGNVVPFVQLDRKTREQQGLGLGLFLTRRIVDRCQGDLHISSSDAGTRVTVVVPEPEEPVS